MAYDANRVVKKLGKRIAELRRERGWSQAVLAKKLRATPQWVSQMERGTRSSTTDTLVKLANAFEVSIASLFEDEAK